MKEEIKPDIVIDASNLVVGRFATFAAKQALLGKVVSIVNCQDAIFTGKRQSLLKHFRGKYSRGEAQKGPFISRLPDRIVKRVVRGMLPYKQERGRTAFQRVMCYVGVPDNLKELKALSLDNAHISKLKNENYITVKAVSLHLRGK